LSKKLKVPTGLNPEEIRYIESEIKYEGYLKSRKKRWPR